MDEIKQIQEKITPLLQLIEGEEKKLSGNTKNLALELSIKSLKYQLSELQAELRIEKAKREKEFIEIRLKGRSADGSISLKFLSELASGFSGTILSASKNIQFGNKGSREKITELIDTVNLRLIGLAPGSTRLYITANTAPDLFGNSLAEKSLKQSFHLLQSQSPEQLIESASVMGKASVNSLRKFVSSINNNNLEVDIKWSSPENKPYEWIGEKQNMLSIVNSLSKIVMSEPETISFKGELITISMKGNFEIIDEQTKKTYRGNYSNEIVETAKQLNIGHRYSGEIEKKTVIIQATEAEKVYYTLLSIRKI